MMEEPGKVDAAPALGDARILVVEDDFLISMELEAVLRDAGAEIVALCRTVDEALAVADGNEVTVAVLDVRLGREEVIPVARRLAERGTPFVFYTGQVNTDSLHAEWPSCKIIQKPAHPTAIIRALVEQLRR